MNKYNTKITRQDIINHAPPPAFWRWLATHRTLSVSEVWQTCPDPDWLLWLLGHFVPLPVGDWVRLALAFVRDMPLVDGERTVYALLSDANRIQARIAAVERYLQGETVHFAAEDSVMAESGQADTAFTRHRYYDNREYVAYLAAAAAAQHVYTMCCFTEFNPTRLTVFTRQVAHRAAWAYIIDAEINGVAIEQAAPAAQLLQADIVRRHVLLVGGADEH